MKNFTAFVLGAILAVLVVGYLLFNTDVDKDKDLAGTGAVTVVSDVDQAAADVDKVAADVDPATPAQQDATKANVQPTTSVPAPTDTKSVDATETAQPATTKPADTTEAAQPASQPADVKVTEATTPATQ